MGFAADSWTTGGIPKQSTASNPAPNPYAVFGPKTENTVQDQAAVLTQCQISNVKHLLKS